MNDDPRAELVRVLNAYAVKRMLLAAQPMVRTITGVFHQIGEVIARMIPQMQMLVDAFGPVTDLAERRRRRTRRYNERMSLRARARRRE